MRAALLVLVVVVVAVAVALAGAACQSSVGSPPVTPVVRTLVTAGHDLAAGASTGDETWSLAELQKIAARIREAMRRDATTPPTTTISKIVFEELGFVREVDDTDLRFVLLPSVLRSRRGSCVGLGTLYLALGQMLALPIEGVMVPGHFFVRLVEGDGRKRNVELLRRGESMPDEWYRGRWPIPGGSAAAYERALAPDEVLGVVEYDIGQEHRRRGRLTDARRAFQSAARHFPDFAEAHASLGATLHLLGELTQAAAAYDAARRVNPHLPGVDRNLKLLNDEVAARQ